MDAVGKKLFWRPFKIVILTHIRRLSQVGESAGVYCEVKVDPFDFREIVDPNL